MQSAEERDAAYREAAALDLVTLPTVEESQMGSEADYEVQREIERRPKPHYDNSDPFDLSGPSHPGIDFRKLMRKNRSQVETQPGDTQMNAVSAAALESIASHVNAGHQPFSAHWSRFQTAIFSWVIEAGQQLATPRAAVVKAVAGSGKTTTIVEAARYIPQSAPSVFLAFNKKIAEELSRRLPSNIPAMTLNSLGYRAVKSKLPRVQVDADKVRKIIKNLPSMQSLYDDRSYKPQYHVPEIGGLVAKAKAHGLVPSSGLKGELATADRWAELAEFYGIYSELPEDVLFEACQKVLELNCRDTDTIDFDDQLYFVVAFDIAVPQYQWIIVDEAQDLSHINREMLKKFLAPTGKLIAVGDDAQAIYGFRGADSSSLDKIVEEFKAEVLPLSISYRCPRNVVLEAQKYVPSIEASPTAADGLVEHLEKFNIADFLDTDMVVCRNTAPILKQAYRLIRARRSCRVLGRDIGTGLITLVKKVAGRKFDTIDMAGLETKLGDWMMNQIAILKRRDQESKIESVQDRVSSILEIISGSECQTCEQLCSEISKLFEGNRGVTLCTVHRAKGLEARRVFILNPSLMPSKMAKQAWQRKQETNLLYVAITRSLETLYFLEDKVIQ